MPDQIFANPRLAVLYDHFDNQRDDLDHYVDIADEFDASTVVDIGCGTGSLAVLLSARGVRVVGVDPAAASLEVARRKLSDGAVRWIHGTAVDLPPVDADLAVMTGNVAQVFLEDDDWATTLSSIGGALKPGGHLVFETRDPSKKAWEGWTSERPARSVDVPGVGVVEARIELVDVSLPFVTFRHVYRFESDGSELTSDSTLRFRSREEVEHSLVNAGYEVVDVRDAPDRPGLEFVFIARRSQAPA